MFSSQFFRYLIFFGLFSIIFGKIISNKYIGLPINGIKLSGENGNYLKRQKILFDFLNGNTKDWSNPSKYKIYDSDYPNQLPYENEYPYYRRLNNLRESKRFGAFVATKPINVYSKQKVLHVPSSVNHYVQHSIGPIMETHVEEGEINSDELYL